METVSTHKPFISRKTLIVLSGIADAADVLCLAGLSPGPWSLVLDLPITVLHFLHAGPKAAVVLLDNLPGVGLFPCYTAAALFLYPDDAAPASTPTAAPRGPEPKTGLGPVIEVASEEVTAVQPPALPADDARPVYVVIDGRQTGPHPITQVRALLQQGRVSGGTLVWREGMDNWARLETVTL